MVRSLCGGHCPPYFSGCVKDVNVLNDRDRQLRISVEDLLTNQILLADGIVAELS